MQCFFSTCNIASASAFYPSRPQKNPQNYPHFSHLKIRRSPDPQIRILPEAIPFNIFSLGLQRFATVLLRLAAFCGVLRFSGRPGN